MLNLLSTFRSMFTNMMQDTEKQELLSELADAGRKDAAAFTDAYLEGFNSVLAERCKEFKSRFLSLELISEAPDQATPEKTRREPINLLEDLPKMNREDIQRMILMNHTAVLEKLPIFSWNDLRSVAKTLGINTLQKKRAAVEAALTKKINAIVKNRK